MSGGKRLEVPDILLPDIRDRPSVNVSTPNTRFREGREEVTNIQVAATAACKHSLRRVSRFPILLSPFLHLKAGSTTTSADCSPSRAKVDADT